MSNGTNKVIIVTGASRGIGQAVARHLAAPLQRCNVLVVARTKEALEKLKADHEGNVEFLVGDMSDTSVGFKAVNAALKRWGRLDGLVVNHGRLEPVEKVAEGDIAEWKKTFDINVFSAVAMIQAALPALRESNGRIILTSSGAATKGYQGWGAYGASKAVFNSLAMTLAVEEKDVTTVAVRPGVVATEMQETMARDHYGKMGDDAERFRKMREEGKMLRPDQPGNVIARLVISAPAGLSGKFLNWNDKELKDFQDF